MTTVAWLLLAFGGGSILSFYIARKIYRYDIEKMLRVSAEKVATSSLSVEKEARRTANEIEKYNNNTSVADGNSLLSG